MRGNTIILHLQKGTVTRTGSLYQYDYGQRLILTGVTLPSAYEVHFSNSDLSTSKTMIGDSTGVDIPDEYLLTGAPVYVWVYLHTGDDDGETEFHGIISVLRRAQPTDQEPTPVQQDVITQTIAALNTAVEEAEAAAASIKEATATAETLAPGSDATATLTESDGVFSFEFGIPQGAKGDQGIQGERGPQGIQGVQGIQGEPGQDGKDGKDGKDGADGQPGADGKDGKDGKDGADGYTPVKGTDYWTDSDKDEIVADASAAVENDIIDDSAGAGDTGKVWSADKSASVASGKYELPSGGIPSTDLSSGVQSSLGLADSAYQKPNSGIPATDLASGVIPDVPVQDVQVNGTSVLSNGVANIPIASDTNPGVARVKGVNGIRVNSNGELEINYPSDAQIKAGSAYFRTLVPALQDKSTFYGLAKCAGDSTQSASSNAVGTYTDEAKAAIKTMLGVSDDISDLKNSKAPVILDSAEGSIVSITDGADNLPVESLVVNIEPVQSGSGDPSPSNVRPISGASSVNVFRTGKNLFDASADTLLRFSESGYHNYTFSDGTLHITGLTFCGFKIPVEEKTQYAWSFSTTSSVTVEGFDYTTEPDKIRNGDDHMFYYQQNQTTGGAFTTPAGCKWIAFAVTTSNTVDITDFNLEVGSTATAYEPYIGHSYPVTFPDTIYGGTLDITSGVLTATHKMQTITGHEGVTYNIYNGSLYNGSDLFFPDSKSGVTLFGDCSMVKTLSNGSIANSVLAKSNSERGIQFYDVVNLWGLAETTSEALIIQLQEWNANGTPLQVVYELATPYTVQLTPTEIKTLLGQNNIWADAGDVEVTYRADTKLFCQKNDTVDDVRINGTSVVQNGVANVPIASPDAFGVVKVRENSDGLLIDGNNRLVIAGAPSSLIKSAGTNYRPVTPLRQHESAFYGLAKAAGADMASSSNSVGTYTDAAKKAIREMLGIPNFDSEVIFETTTTEDLTEFSITTDNNGQEFELRACKIYVKLPASTTGTTDYVTMVYTIKTVDDLTGTFSFPTLKMPTSSGALMVYEFETFPGGMYFIRGFASSGFGSSSSGGLTLCQDFLIKFIKGFKLKQYSQSSTLIPSGTKIKVIGIRI